jgi:DNA polymerase-3 subunit alpha
MNFCHLHVHTEFSVLDGFGLLPKIVARAKELGFEALALTDHATASGCNQFYNLCKAADIKPIIGCEMYFVDDCLVKPISKDEIDRTLLDHEPSEHAGIKEQIKAENSLRKKRDHITLLVANETGYHNLMSIIADAHLIGAIEGGYGRMIGRTDWVALEKHHEGLIAMTACSGGILSRPLKDDNYDLALDRASKLDEIFKGNLYIEIMPINDDDQRKCNLGLIDISNDTGIPMVATNDCHYIHKNEARTHDILLAIQQGKALDDPDLWSFSCRDLYMRTRQEMEEAFGANHPGISDDIVRSALDATCEIAAKITFDFPVATQRLPNLDITQSNGYDGFGKWKQAGGQLKLRESIETLVVEGHEE